MTPGSAAQRSMKAAAAAQPLHALHPLIYSHAQCRGAYGHSSTQQLHQSTQLPELTWSMPLGMSA